MDRGAWWATVHRIAKSQTQLKWLSTVCDNYNNLSLKEPIEISITIPVLEEAKNDLTAYDVKSLVPGHPVNNCEV